MNIIPQPVHAKEVNSGISGGKINQLLYCPSIGTPTKDVHSSETMNTLFLTTFMTNPMIGGGGKCLHSRQECLLVYTDFIKQLAYKYKELMLQPSC